LLSIAAGVVMATLAVRSVNRTLARVVAELRQGSEQVASAAEQVATASQSLAQGASNQAAALEQTSASSSEIHSIAARNGDNARQAAESVNRSAERFSAANQALREMVMAMGEVHSESEKVGRIMKVIDEIAFQTNILALNAAVEAARAGEAGMGFAVVADEVRNLAQRCAQAARDTTELIEGAIAKSTEGKARVDRVAAGISAISAESERVKDLVEHVHRGSEEQTLGLAEVTKAVAEMQHVTQSNAAAAEQSAAAAEELSAQAETLRHTAGHLSELVGG
jgi:methyl-accepting chemotaxis protein/methyl-accepting chemotaxis protein-1 (serine sensor receptor)